MGKIFYIIGKSSSGKDTIFKKIKDNKNLSLKTIVPYTTRPIRDGEEEGVQYHFVDEEVFWQLNNKGSVIESRVYNTVHGDWRYFSVDDGNINLKDNSYIVIGTLESYTSFVNYFEKGSIVPIFIEVDDGERLARALERERRPENQKYAEMCRRFLADLADFSEEKIAEAGIGAENRFANDEFDKCVEEIEQYILKEKDKIN